MFKLLGWVLTLALAAAAVATLDPARLGLSTVTPVAQAIAMRPYLVAGFVVGGAVVLLPILVAALVGRRWPRVTLLSVVMLAVGLGHAWVLYDRGLGDDPLPAARDGAVTVLTLNTLGGGASVEQVTAAAVDVGADVLALAETSESSARAVATVLTERSGTQFQVFVEATGPWDASSTALLISAGVGEYAQAQAPETAHGAVRAEPVSGEGPAFLSVHPRSPHAPGPAMDRWRADLDAATDPCRTESDLIVAGDFNATLDHAPMRDIGVCVDAATEAGVGGVATWPAHMPRLIGAQIDHVLLDGERYVVDAASVLDVGESDHRAVVAQISPAS
ncbi:endonuclease/exonuclease/phosphatase family protein [Georgenia sp. H159]|uniref:endonuclease/exonuclease/phosphatase family protein n=1 Tax=Georgenia sp. H159 TaxID=3076115 RepID=UPI002D779F54|nr:endonuclease/exonuclease/phosphatase family protein [Georgenia sp. H159]